MPKVFNYSFLFRNVGRKDIVKLYKDDLKKHDNKHEVYANSYIVIFQTISKRKSKILAK